MCIYPCEWYALPYILTEQWHEWWGAIFSRLINSLFGKSVHVCIKCTAFIRVSGCIADCISWRTGLNWVSHLSSKLKMPQQGDHKINLLILVFYQNDPCYPMTLNINRKILSQLLLASPPFPNDTNQKRPGKRSKWTQENHPPKIFDTTAADSKVVCNCHQTDIWLSWLAGAQICLPGLQTFCPQPVNDHLKRIWIEDKGFLQWELDSKLILYLIVLSPQGPLSPILDQHQSIIKLGEVLGITLMATICGKKYTNYVNVFLTNLTQEKCYNLD